MKASIELASGLVSPTLEDELVLSEDAKGLTSAELDGQPTYRVETTFDSPPDEGLFGLGQPMFGTSAPVFAISSRACMACRWVSTSPVAPKILLGTFSSGTRGAAIEEHAFSACGRGFRAVVFHVEDVLGRRSISATFSCETDACKGESDGKRR